VVNRSNLIYNIMVRRGIVVPEYEEVELTSPGSSQDNNSRTVTPIEETKPASN
jgi:hypothetical protein